MLVFSKTNSDFTISLPLKIYTMTITTEKISILEQYIENANKIVLICHASPDADTIGSALAFGNILKQHGKEVKVVSPNVVPDFISWMSGIDEVIVDDNQGKICQRTIRYADLLFAMDFNAPHRTNNLEMAMDKFRGTKVLIDHHLFPDEKYFDLLFSEPGKSSTSELLFDILRNSIFKQYINKDIATNIFVGLMTDTGSFAYSCDKPETFETAAELIRYGVKAKETHDLVYNNNSVARLQILGDSIANRLRIFPEQHAAYFALSSEDITKYGNAEGLTEGIVNYALSIKGICFAALLTEKDDKIKMSFRSKGTYSVNEFARAHFQGGGHHNAAGGKSYLSLEETTKKLDDLISKIDIEC